MPSVVFDDCPAIVDACCLAWNRFAENPETATPITAHQPAQVNLQGRWYCADWLRQRRSVKGGVTLDGIVAGMAAVHGVTVHRGSVGTWLQWPGLSHENTLLASEILRLKVAEAAGRHGLKRASLTWSTCRKGWCSSTKPASGPSSSRPLAGLPPAGA